MRTGLIIIALLAAAAAALSGITPGASASFTAAVTAAAQDAAQTVKAPTLTKSHSGWRQPACLECHDASVMGAAHKDAGTLKPADCAPCHGYNGAPDADHAIAFNPCASCHARVPHAASFKVPAECIGCHQQGSGDRRQATGKGSGAGR